MQFVPFSHAICYYELTTIACFTTQMLFTPDEEEKVIIH